MPRRHRSTAALVLAVSLIAAGCASGDGRGQDAPSAAAAPSASADPVPLLTAEPMDDLGAITPSWSGTYLPPTWDQEAEDAAVQRASQTMTAYLAGTDQETWWQGLLPHLTPEAQAVYRYTDATRVPPAPPVCPRPPWTPAGPLSSRPRMRPTSSPHWSRCPRTRASSASS